MLRVVCLQVFCLFALSEISRACPKSLLASSGTPWNQQINFEAVELLLKCGAPMDVVPLGKYFQSLGRTNSGTSESYMVIFSPELRAIFKPEDPLEGSYGELGTYSFSQWMKLPIVPPTVIRELTHQALGTHARWGSLQYFITTHHDTGKQDTDYWRQKTSPRLWSQMTTLIFVLGQWDFYSDNFVIDDVGTPALIDNFATTDLSIQKLGEHPFQFMGSRQNEGWPNFGAADLVNFPGLQAKQLTEPSIEQMTSVFSGYIGRQRLKRWHERVHQKHPGKILNYMLWKGGLWFQRLKKYGEPAIPVCYDPATINQLRRLNAEALNEIWPAPLSRAHQAAILDRARQVIEQSQHLPLCTE